MAVDLTQEWLATIVDAAATSLVGFGYQLILFGSRAKGSAHVRSDIDIAVRTESALPPAAWSHFEELLEESDIPVKVDVVDYQRVSEGFRKVIDEHGIPLK